MASSATAAVVVESALRSWGISYRMPRSPEEGDLVVMGKTVKVGAAAGSFDFVVDADAVTGSDLEATKAELARLTEFLGLGRLDGWRNASNAKRAKTDDYEATSLRLTSFARTLNPPAADMKRWAPLVKREADRAFYKYQRVAWAMRMDRDDLYSIGLVFLTNYLHRNRHNTNLSHETACLVLHLHQEFRRWATVSAKKSQSVAPVLDGVSMDTLVGMPSENAAFDDDGTYSFDIEQPAEANLEPVFASIEEAQKYNRKRAMVEGRYHAARQRNAAVALEDGLANMPHERLVQALATVMRSGVDGNPDVFDAEAKEEAARRFRAHMKVCKACQDADVAWTEYHKEQRTKMSKRGGRRAPGKFPAFAVNEPTPVEPASVTSEHGVA